MLARGDLLTPWFNDRPRFEKPVGLYWLQLPFVAVLGSSELAARLRWRWPAPAGAVHLSDRAQAVWRAGGLDRGARPRDVLPRHHARTSGPDRHSGALLRADRDARLPARASGRVVGPGLDGRLGRDRACGVEQGAGGGDPPGRLGGVPDGDARLERASPPAHRAGRARRCGHCRALVRLHDGGARAGVRGRGARQRSRLTGGRRRRAAPGLLYYFDVWPAELLPWTPFFLLALGYFALARARVTASERRAALFPAVWFLVVVGAFSLSSSKLPHYILPAYPAARCSSSCSSIAPERTRPPVASGGPVRALWSRCCSRRPS